MTNTFDHPMHPIVSSYPQIAMAAGEISRQVIDDIVHRAPAITEVWKSGVVCAICDLDHDQDLPNHFTQIGKPMDQLSRKKMLLEEVVRELERLI